jgi:ATP phosphoribosyltransferase
VGADFRALSHFPGPSPAQQLRGKYANVVYSVEQSLGAYPATRLQFALEGNHGKGWMNDTLGNRNVKLALQREGRLSRNSTDLLETVGLEFDSYRQKLFAACRNFDLELLFVRDDDIPEYVADGVADLGIVGRNLVLEYGRPVQELLPLHFGYCSLVVAVPNESPAQTVRDLASSRVATSYPNSARSYFEKKGIPVQIIPISGSVELTPTLGVAQGIVELTATGSTLRLNDLRELATIYTSEAILMANEASLRNETKRKTIDRLCVRFKAAIEARKYKYIMMNAPRSALEQLESVTPGLKSPTILDLADPDWVAVHAAVEAEMFWDVIEKLRELGASEILVTPIESMIM